MRADTGEWDVRCPEELRSLFPKRVGYYFRVDHDTAKRVLRILSDSYQIPSPNLARLEKGRSEHAMYVGETSTVLVRGRNHLKSLFHEFYHHLDNMTDGKYDSNDREGGSSSLAWVFAEKLWAIFRRRDNLT